MSMGVSEVAREGAVVRGVAGALVVGAVARLVGVVSNQVLLAAPAADWTKVSSSVVVHPWYQRWYFMVLHGDSFVPSVDCRRIRAYPSAPTSEARRCRCAPSARTAVATHSSVFSSSATMV